MKNIVFLRSNPIKPDPRVEKEANALIKRGKNVLLVGWNRERKDKICTIEIKKLLHGNVELNLINIESKFGAGFKQNLIPLIKFQCNLLKWLIKNKQNYEIIHACDFDTVIPAYICSKILGKKYIYDIFDYYVDAYSVPNKLKKIISKIDRYMINQAEGTIICTEKRREQIKGSNPKKLVVIHNTPDIKISTIKSEKKKEGKIKIAYIGILSEGRMIKELVDIVSENEELELHIGGFGKLDKYILEKSDVHNNIIFYGKMKYERVIELEEECDIMTALYDPNIQNHFYAAPNKFYEALALGKPLIMVKNTGMDYIIEENKFGEIIDFNKNSLKIGIEKLIKRKAEWNDISINMRRYYEKNFLWANMEKELFKVYKELT